MWPRFLGLSGWVNTPQTSCPSSTSRRSDATAKVLDLVAEAAGGQALVLRLKPVAVPVLGTDTDDIGPRHLAVFPGDTEAALQAGLLALGVDDLRVDQLDELVILVQHHAHTAQHTHLGRGQAHAAGLLQRVRHVIQQRAETAVEVGHRAADLGQALLALQCYLS